MYSGHAGKNHPVTYTKFFSSGLERSGLRVHGSEPDQGWRRTGEICNILGLVYLVIYFVVIVDVNAFISFKNIVDIQTPPSLGDSSRH